MWGLGVSDGVKDGGVGGECKHYASTHTQWQRERERERESLKDQEDRTAFSKAEQECL